MSYSEVRGLPIPHRSWYLKRLSKQFADEARAHKEAVKSSRSSSHTRSKEVPVDEIMEAFQEKSFKNV